MDEIALLRAISLLAPVVALVAAMRFIPTTARQKGALFLAFLWNVLALLLANILAVELGWWTFTVRNASITGVPLDMLLGWSILWGPLFVLVAAKFHVRIALTGAVLLDLAFMPQLEPLLYLSENWLYGEVLCLAVALIPGMFFADATWSRKRLSFRVIMQMITFSGALFVLMPLALASTDWGSSVRIPAWSPLLSIGAQVLAVPGVIALVSVQELAKRGKGTPFPWDPTTTLVTSGPYAYVRNPMQVATSAMMLLVSLACQSSMLFFASVFCVVFSIGIAERHEHDHLVVRFRDAYTHLHSVTRSWWPTWKPAATIPAAKLYVASTCEPCTGVGHWFLRRLPVNLEVVSAESHPQRLRRVRYEADGVAVSGIIAIGYALEHCNFAWAWLGWCFRLPVLSTFFQMIMDAAGAGPRDLCQPTSAATGRNPVAASDFRTRAPRI